MSEKGSVKIATSNPTTHDFETKIMPNIRVNGNNLDSIETHINKSHSQQYQYKITESIDKINMKGTY